MHGHPNQSHPAVLNFRSVLNNMRNAPLHCVTATGTDLTPDAATELRLAFAEALAATSFSETMAGILLPVDKCMSCERREQEDAEIAPDITDV